MPRAWGPTAATNTGAEPRRASGHRRELSTSCICWRKWTRRRPWLEAGVGRLSPLEGVPMQRPGRVGCARGRASVRRGGRAGCAPAFSGTRGPGPSSATGCAARMPPPSGCSRARRCRMGSSVRSSNRVECQVLIGFVTGSLCHGTWSRMMAFSMTRSPAGAGCCRRKPCTASAGHAGGRARPDGGDGCRCAVRHRHRNGDRSPDPRAGPVGVRGRRALG